MGPGPGSGPGRTRWRSTGDAGEWPLLREWAIGEGAVRLGLWVVEGNVAAERLYRSVGFERTGQTELLPGDPSRTEVRMTCALPRS